MKPGRQHKRCITNEYKKCHRIRFTFLGAIESAKETVSREGTHLKQLKMQLKGENRCKWLQFESLVENISQM